MIKTTEKVAKKMNENLIVYRIIILIIINSKKKQIPKH